MNNEPNKYMNHIEGVAMADVAMLRKKDEQYGGSWCRRGGHSAAENVMRKVDRLTVQLEKHGWDIFAAVKATKHEQEGVIDTIRDLRGYLLLCEGELHAQGVFNLPPRHIDQTGQDRPHGFQPEENELRRVPRP